MGSAASAGSQPISYVLLKCGKPTGVAETGSRSGKTIGWSRQEHKTDEVEPAWAGRVGPLVRKLPKLLKFGFWPKNRGDKVTDNGQNRIGESIINVRHAVSLGNSGKCATPTKRLRRKRMPDEP